MANRELNIVARIDAKNAVKGSQKTQKAVRDIKGETDKASTSVKKLGKNTTAATGIMQSGFIGQIPIVGRYQNTLQTAIGTTRTLTASTNAFKIALAATGIGAIIVALGALIQAFRSTQEGTDRLNRVLVPLKSVFQAIWGVIQNVSIALADTLVAAIKSPGQTILDFGRLVRDNIINRFKAITDIGGAVGKVLKGIFTFDSDIIKEGTAEAGDAFLQLGTGVEDTGKKIEDFWTNLSESVNEGTEAGKRIQKLTEQIENLQIEQAVPLSRLKREYRELYNTARDTQLTEEERLKATDQAIAKRRQMADMETRVLDLEIERLKIKNSLNDTDRPAQLALQKMIAMREEIAARTEQELSRILSARNGIVSAIENEIAKEEEAAQKRITAMEEQAEKYLELTLTEEELAQKKYEKELGMVKALYEEQIITEEEFLAIRKELEDEFLLQKQEKETAHVGSIMQLEQQLAQARIAYRQAVTDADRAAHADEIKRIQERLNAITKAEGQAGKSRKKSLEQAAAGQIAYGKSVKENIKGAIDAMIAEAVAAQIRNIIATVPFPANLLLAAGAAGAVTALRSQIPEFREGGLISPGKKIISVNEDGRAEYVVNARSTRRALPLLEEINRNPGFADNLVNSLEYNQFLGGGLVGRANYQTGADLPFRSAGIGNIVPQLVQALERAQLRADVDVRKVDEELTEYQLQQGLIGN